MFRRSEGPSGWKLLLGTALVIVIGIAVYAAVYNGKNDDREQRAALISKLDETNQLLVRGLTFLGAEIPPTLRQAVDGGKTLAETRREEELALSSKLTDALAQAKQRDEDLMTAYTKFSESMKALQLSNTVIVETLQRLSPKDFAGLSRLAPLPGPPQAGAATAPTGAAKPQPAASEVHAPEKPRHEAKPHEARKPRLAKPPLKLPESRDPRLPRNEPPVGDPPNATQLLNKEEAAKAGQQKHIPTLEEQQH